MSNWQPFRVLSALALYPTICPGWDRPGLGRESKAIGGPFLRPGWLAPSNLKQFSGGQALGAGLEHAGALAAPQPNSWVLGEGEGCHH